MHTTKRKAYSNSYNGEFDHAIKDAGTVSAEPEIW